MDTANIIGELLPLATSLFSLIEKIRTDSPDAWASVTAQYGEAVANWDAAKGAFIPPQPHAPETAKVDSATSAIITSVEGEQDKTNDPEPISNVGPINESLGVPKKVGWDNWYERS